MKLTMELPSERSREYYINKFAVSRADVWAKCTVLIVALLLLCSCQVQLVSQYDDVTDQKVTALHQRVETFLITVASEFGSPDCRYEKHKDFYIQTKVDISAIDVRARAIPNNAITIQQIENLTSSLDDLESLHKLGCFSANGVATLRSSFNTSFTAILKLELAKKRGQ